MRICIIGDFSDNLDEGYKNIAFYLTKELSNRHEVLRLNIKELCTIKFWKSLNNFNPQIIHYLTAPTVSSFFLLKLVSTRFKTAKTILSALHPQVPMLCENLISCLKPNLMLVQSQEDKIKYEKLDMDTAIIPNGVDEIKFAPVSKEKKLILREKYGIDKEKFVILHVGHIRSVRNIQILPRIIEKNDLILIVASTYMKIDKLLYKDLKKNCTIWLGYQKNIEEIYTMCDCYVFPVTNYHSILTPLSVLEAMSCNIPVITTKFDGLKTFFQEGDGLYFAESETDFCNLIKFLKNNKLKIVNREKILLFSWSTIARRLIDIYEKI